MKRTTNSLLHSTLQLAHKLTESVLSPSPRRHPRHTTSQLFHAPTTKKPKRKPRAK